MRKQLLFLTTMLLLFATSCQKKEFDIYRMRELATLHHEPSDYTEGEVKEIQDQIELYLVSCENMLNDALSERDSYERKMKMADVAARLSSEKVYLDTVGELIDVLRYNEHTDKKRLDELSRLASGIVVKIGMIRKEM